MEILIEELKKSPGLVLVFAFIALLLLEDSSEISAAIRVFVVAWGLYWIGGRLDCIFDCVYGPGPRPRAEKGLWTRLTEESKQPNERAETVPEQKNTWKKMVKQWINRCKQARVVRLFAITWGWLRETLLPGFRSLEKARDAATETLKLPGRPQVAGVYNRAKEALEENNRWKTDVEPWINRSKAVRTFVLPLFAVAVVRATPLWLPLIPPQFQQWLKRLNPEPLLEFLKHLFVALEPLFASFTKDFVCAREKLEVLFLTCSVYYAFVPAGLCFFCLLVYVWLRVHHMTKMYDLVVNPRPNT